jgi:hypothetical protein
MATFKLQRGGLFGRETCRDTDIGVADAHKSQFDVYVIVIWV